MALSDRLRELQKLIKAINPDPCNRTANRRNAQGTIAAMNEIKRAIEEVDGGGSGLEVILFQVTVRDSDTVGQARKIIWGGSSYDLDATVTVNDWTADNMFSCNLQVGHQGVAVRDVEKGENEYSIVVLEGKARWVQGTNGS